MSDALVEIERATVVRGGVPVLHELSLSIRAGEHTAIVGPNGAGKSALVSLFTLEERARAGAAASASVRVFGRQRWDVFELRAQLGIVSAAMHHRFVNGNSQGRITGIDAVLSGFFASHGFANHGRATPEMRQGAAEALRRMGATHLDTKPLDAMSSGEARRVLLARALVCRPRALMLDEPTTGLDLVARTRFIEDVREIARTGTTLILVTHHIEEIVPEIDRVLLLKHGRIVFDGPKREALTETRLANTFDAPITLTEAKGYYHARA